MVCPVCKQEIPDSSIICPLCNTQFTFNAPSSIQTFNNELYKGGEENTNFVSEANLVPNEGTIPAEEITQKLEEKNNSNPITYFASEEAKINENTISNNEQNIVNEQIYNSSTGISSSQLGTEPNNNMLNNNASIGNSFQTTGNFNNTVMPNNEISNSQVNDLTSINNQQPLNNSVNAINAVGVGSEELMQDKKRKHQRENLFFIGVIVIGFLVLLFMMVMMLKPKKNITLQKTSRVSYTHTVPPLQETKNVGVKSTYNYPMKIGNTTIASYFDSSKNQYIDVDVKGLRFITGEEAEELANLYGQEQLREGFTWYGLEYEVQLNDLTYLNGEKINPTLNAKFYKWNGCDFITYNEHNYMINVSTVSKNALITNGERAIMKVIYQLPPTEDEYSICFGDIDNTLGCFTNS